MFKFLSREKSKLIFYNQSRHCQKKEWLEHKQHCLLGHPASGRVNTDPHVISHHFRYKAQKWVNKHRELVSQTSYMLPLLGKTQLGMMKLHAYSAYFLKEKVHSDYMDIQVKWSKSRQPRFFDLNIRRRPIRDLMKVHKSENDTEFWSVLEEAQGNGHSVIDFTIGDMSESPDGRGRPQATAFGLSWFPVAPYNKHLEGTRWLQKETRWLQKHPL